MAVRSLHLLLIALLVAGCGGRQAQPETEEAEVHSVTNWTEQTELFAEYPPLVVGETSRFAIHLTRLDTFRALTEGSAEVRLIRTGDSPEVFRVEKPTRPGIFGVDVRPTHPGSQELVITLRSGTLADEHRIGQVEVFPNRVAAEKAAGASQEPGPQAISFLKEQQWALDFATAVVGERSLRESLRVPAQVAARPGGSADVVAPVDGRLVDVAALSLGAPVRQAQELARLLPPTGEPGDAAQFEQARGEAQARLDLARSDRERAERLAAAGAVPQKRVDEARAAEQIAETRVRAAQARLAQHTAARTGQSSSAAALFSLRAPLSGTLTTRNAATGANVTAGAVLFRIVDTSQVQIVGRVPEADAPRVRLVTAAEVEAPGFDSPIPAGPPVSQGHVIDPDTRTLSIVFALDNRQLRLAVGQATFLRLLFNPAPSRPTVLAAAVVDDGGRAVVFVQTEGEAFERRPVTLGPRQGELVQILEGVKAGERVVTKGAYLVRLASLSTQMPSHGHVH